MEVKPIMDKHTNYNELKSKNVSDQTSSDNLSNDSTVHHQSTIQNEESQDNRLMAMLIYLLSLFTACLQLFYLVFYSFQDKHGHFQ